MKKDSLILGVFFIYSSLKLLFKPLLEFLASLVAIDASITVEEPLYSALGAADAMRILANCAGDLLAHNASVINALGIKKHKDESHSYVPSKLGLIEVMSTLIFINIYRYLVYSWEWMHDRKVGFCIV
jgi:hypothetical protein